jgi:hypothetical protein
VLRGVGLFVSYCVSLVDAPLYMIVQYQVSVVVLVACIGTLITHTT